MKDPMPVFTIKGKDALAYPAIMAYCKLATEHGLFEQAGHTRLAADEIRDWQQRNIDATKLPDHQHVPVTEGGTT